MDSTDAHRHVRDASAAAVANGHRPVLPTFLEIRREYGVGTALMALDILYGPYVHAAVWQRVAPFLRRKTGFVSAADEPRVKYRGRF